VDRGAAYVPLGPPRDHRHRLGDSMGLSSLTTCAGTPCVRLKSRVEMQRRSIALSIYRTVLCSVGAAHQLRCVEC
jgi:hypothetical protein